MEALVVAPFKTTIHLVALPPLNGAHVDFEHDQAEWQDGRRVESHVGAAAARPIQSPSHAPAMSSRRIMLMRFALPFFFKQYALDFREN